MPQLAQGRTVEGRRAHSGDAEQREPLAQLARRLVRERDRHDLRRGKRARDHLLRDPAGDRGRLAGARPREDAHRSAHRLRGAPLLGIQAAKWVHPATVPAPAAGNRHDSVAPRSAARERLRGGLGAAQLGSRGVDGQAGAGQGDAETLPQHLDGVVEEEQDDRHRDRGEALVRVGQRLRRRESDLGARRTLRRQRHHLVAVVDAGRPRAGGECVP